MSPLAIHIASFLITLGIAQSPCPAGKRISANKCLPCPPRSISTMPNSLTCTLCPANTAPRQRIFDLRPNSTACLPCPPGFSVNNETGACSPCPTGSYSTTNFSTSCTACPNGQGTLKPGTSDPKSCFRCPPGSLVSNQKYFGKCSVCGYDFFSNGTGRADKCQKCPPGSISGIEAAACTTCQPGTFFAKINEYRSECRRCPPGTYTPSRGSLSCQSCPIGSTPNSFQSGCIAVCPGPLCSTACPAGREGIPGKISKCQPCAINQFNPTGSITPCSYCPSPRSPDAARSGCVCPKGQAPTESNGECSKCPAGAKSPDGLKCRCATPRRFIIKEARCACPLNWRPVGLWRCVKCSKAEIRAARDFKNACEL